MAFIEWNPELSVGVLAIDHQHAHLLRVVNALHNAMMREGNPAEVFGILVEVISYARQHFAFEERILERRGYPGLEKLREKHKAMFTEVQCYVKTEKTGAIIVSPRLMPFLKEWIGDHIAQTDEAYSSHPVNAWIGAAVAVE